MIVYEVSICLTFSLYIGDSYVVRAGPGRGILDVIVARHVLGDKSDGEVRVFRQGESSGKTYYSCAGGVLVP
jgi:hypothetical protein